MPKADLLTSEQRKNLLFELVNNITNQDWGKSATWATLDLIEAVGNGRYYATSKNCGFPKRLKEDQPELYDDLAPFFHQNRPENWDDPED